MTDIIVHALKYYRPSRSIWDKSLSVLSPSEESVLVYQEGLCPFLQDLTNVLARGGDAKSLRKFAMILRSDSISALLIVRLTPAGLDK